MAHLRWPVGRRISDFCELDSYVNFPSPNTTNPQNTGSPLFFTAYDKPIYFQEAPFAVAGQINHIIMRFFETEGGPLMFSAICGLTLFKMATYYGFFQPSYLWHFQEKYSKSWKVGHHLYGHSMANPLRK